jgi:hypothetical protein
MLSRKAELEEFKKLNLSVIASAHGYSIDRRKSTHHSVLMSSGADKIIISQNGQHYIYCSVHRPDSSGTVIDFAQQVIEPGCTLGRVRQLLRPFLSSGYMSNIQVRCSGRYAMEIKPSEPDLIGVAARYALFDRIDEPHPYLCGVRGVPFDVLQSDRLYGRIRHCPRRGAVIFPHWGSPSGGGDDDRCLVGYEIKGPHVNMYSKGGRKGLWMSTSKPDDRVLAFAESGLDAVSYLARSDNATRVASLSGRMNPDQPALIASAIERMEEGAQIVAAFDNDQAGDELTEKLLKLFAASGRSDLEFRDDRPTDRGADWNEVLVKQSRLSACFRSL